MTRRKAAPSTRPGVRWVAVMALSQALAMACAPTTSNAPFVWANEWPEPPSTEGEYVIGVGDALNVQVWEQEKMSSTVRVRSDGMVSLPFLNDVPASGLTPVALARDLEERLRPFIVTPRVLVAVDEARPLSVSVLGQVGTPGLHSLSPGAGVAQALAAAGGLKDFAKKDRIFVLRSGGILPQRIRMTWDDVTAGLGVAGRFRLRTGDVVVVE
ncbi:MAG: polysaccharide biosynthesis/export family protein [Acidobacteria bacterium]|nr:polysaccharide biosynthesis/export family protein [Acidobacteriota bacterium]